MRSRRSRSIARLRAVARIHADGFGGKAVARPAFERGEVCVLQRVLGERDVAEGARRGSRRCVPRLRGSTVRPVRLASASQVDNRTDLHGSVVRPGAHRRRFQRAVERGGFDDVVAAQPLFRLGERTVGDDALVRRARAPSSRSRCWRAARRRRRRRACGALRRMLPRPASRRPILRGSARGRPAGRRSGACTSSDSSLQRCGCRSHPGPRTKGARRNRHGARHLENLYASGVLARSNRSRSITLAHAATKSRVNFSWASSPA